VSRNTRYRSASWSRSTRRRTAELKRREPAGDEDAELGVLLSFLHRGRGGEL